MTTFHPHKVRALVVVCSSLACAGAIAQSESTSAAPPKGGAKPPAKSTKPAPARDSVLQRQVNAQGQQIEALKKQVADQDARYRELQDRLDKEASRTASGPGGSPRPSAAAAFGGAAVAAGAKAAEGAQPSDGGERPVRVGVAPAATPEPQAPVAQLFDEPSVLTPRGHFVLEPNLQYGYSSSNRVALVGYTVIPAILIGLIDVREQKSNTFVAGLTGRWGVTSRMELELKVPYVIRSDATVSREVFTGSAQDNVFNTKGHSIGDVEMAMRYQLNAGKDGWPYMVGGLRFKSRTGTDPFSVVTDCAVRCVGNTTGTGLPTELPTGSGFYSLQPSLTWLFPTDPAVFFGGINYTYSFARHDVSRRVLNGGTEQLGDIKPGNAWGMNLGMGLALNDRSSFSLGVELYTIGRTQQNGQSVAGSVRTQLASLLLGYSYRMTDRQTLNVSVGAGLTRDTPDLTLTVRVPFSF